MIETEQMKKAVHDEVTHMLGDGFALIPRLAQHRLAREDHIAQQARASDALQFAVIRESQDVGRTILPAVGPVEIADQGVIGQHDACFDRAIEPSAGGVMTKHGLRRTAR